MKVFHFPSIDCRLLVPRVGVDGEQLANFIRSYYITAPDLENAIAILREDLAREGAELVSFEAPIPMSRLRLPFHVLAKAIWNIGPRIEWKSGRAFYIGDSSTSLH